MTNIEKQRVILLLDMDCFYAQCETVRLGLDPELPLALLQWNSALAVNYPARKYGIQRGDSYEKIREKSLGECVTIHLPVTTLSDNSSGNKLMSGSSPVSSPVRNPYQKEEEIKSQFSPNAAKKENQNDNIEEHAMPEEEDLLTAYNTEFNQPSHVREEIYKREKNRMRSRNEGKACLDRYRLASARIFAFIDETLSKSIGKKNYILERASIDELFIDVTAFCNNPDYASNEPRGKADSDGNKAQPPSTESHFRSTCQTDAIASLNETTICDKKNLHPDEIKDENALILGCHIARSVRQSVFRELHFTLSAGISTSKLVAKLGASYGKPNGQAVIFPGAIPKVMDETQIRKARMLGGKLGKKVLSLLPETETTMGSISRLLTLDDLEKAIGEDSGKWVFNACRGICTEEVKPTIKVLPKSITAFKSFSGLGYPELEKWTVLLARDIMKRVEIDSGRHNRLPKSCTLGYTTEPGGAWIGRSVRLPFPTDRHFDARVKRLVESTRKALTQSGHTTIIRLGYSAIDFVTRPVKGIEAFFAAGTKKSFTTHHIACKTLGHNDSQERPKPRGIETFLCPGRHAASKSAPKHHHTLHDYNGNGNTEGFVTSLHAKQSPECPVFLEDTEVQTAGYIHTESILHRATHSNANMSMTDEEIAIQLQVAYDNELGNVTSAASMQHKKEIHRDETLALKLQLSYDREHAVLSDVEKHYSNTKRKSGGLASSQEGRKITKRNQIDSYFSPSK